MYRLPLVAKFARRAIVGNWRTGRSGFVGDVSRQTRGHERTCKKAQALNRLCQKDGAQYGLRRPLRRTIYIGNAARRFTGKTGAQTSALGTQIKAASIFLWATRFWTTTTIRDLGCTSKDGGHFGRSSRRSLLVRSATPDMVRHRAIDVYSFLTRDTSKLGPLSTLICDRNKTDGCKNENMSQDVRMAAAIAHARLVRSKDYLTIHKFMVRRYKKVADEAEAKATKAKASFEKAKAEDTEARKVVEAAMKALAKNAGDKDAKKAKERAEAKLTKTEQIRSEKQYARQSAENRAKGMRGNSTNVLSSTSRARRLASACKNDPNCYAGFLTKSAKEIATLIGTDAKEFKKWKKADQEGLRIAAAERALIELGKLGAKASGTTSVLLSQAGSEERRIREACCLRSHRSPSAPARSVSNNSIK